MAAPDLRPNRVEQDSEQLAVTEEIREGAELARQAQERERQAAEDAPQGSGTIPPVGRGAAQLDRRVPGQSPRSSGQQRSSFEPQRRTPDPRRKTRVRPPRSFAAPPRLPSRPHTTSSPFCRRPGRPWRDTGRSPAGTVEADGMMSPEEFGNRLRIAHDRIASLTQHEDVDSEQRGRGAACRPWRSCE